MTYRSGSHLIVADLDAGVLVLLLQEEMVDGDLDVDLGEISRLEAAILISCRSESSLYCLFSPECVIFTTPRPDEKNSPTARWSPSSPGASTPSTAGRSE